MFHKESGVLSSSAFPLQKLLLTVLYALYYCPPPPSSSNGIRSPVHLKNDDFEGSTAYVTEMTNITVK